MIDRKTHNRTRARINAYHASMRELFPGKNGFTPKDIKAICKQAKIRRSPTNEERSSIEVFEFFHEKPAKYFAYVKRTPKMEKLGLSHHDAFVSSATTWIGEILGQLFAGYPYRSNMGDTRRSVDVLAITGEWYHGTFFESAGDYCRLIKYKNGKRSG